MKTSTAIYPELSDKVSNADIPGGKQVREPTRFRLKITPETEGKGGALARLTVGRTHPCSLPP